MKGKILIWFLLLHKFYLLVPTLKNHSFLSLYKHFWISFGPHRYINITFYSLQFCSRDQKRLHNCKESKSEILKRFQKGLYKD